MISSPSAGSVNENVAPKPGTASAQIRPPAPLSPFDDQIRVAVARSVYGQPSMNRYALGANPSIRIIVKNGHVSLEGVVADKGARDIANLMANGVFGVFSVTNNLQVERR